MIHLSEEELKLVEKFGFRIEGSRAIHKKMGIEKDIALFKDFTTLTELEQYVKGLLRTA